MYDRDAGKAVTGEKRFLSPPIGYEILKVGGGKLQCVNSDKGKLIHKVFHRQVEENLPHIDILKRLKKMGISLREQRLSKILRNPFYCGYFTGKLIDGK